MIVTPRAAKVPAQARIKRTQRTKSGLQTHPLIFYLLHARIRRENPVSTS
jgi:hypothetical protein